MPLWSENLRQRLHQALLYGRLERSERLGLPIDQVQLNRITNFFSDFFSHILLHQTFLESLEDRLKVIGIKSLF